MQNVKVTSENGENKTLSLSSAAVSTKESLMKTEDEQTKKMSASSEHLPTIKQRPYGSMPNISASMTNDGDDNAAIKAPTTAVAVQQVSAEPLEYCPKPNELANYDGPQLRYDIGLVNATVVVPPPAAGEDEIRSPSVTSDLPVSVAEPKHDGSGESDAPTADEVQQVSAEPLEFCPEPIEMANNSGSQMQYDIGLVNVTEMLPPAAAVGEDEIRSPSVTSDMPVSAAETKHDGLGESDAKMSRGLAGLRPRLWCSMPNIHIHYTDQVSYKTAEIECIGQMPVSPDSLTDSITTAVTEPAEVTPVKIKRSSFWKRTKKFARRVFCCGAA